MIDESTIDTGSDIDCDLPGGCIGIVTFDLNPKTTPARVRPFIWSYLLLRGAVRRSEVEAALSGHVAQDDLRVFDDPMDRSHLQVTIDNALAEMVFQNVLRVSGDDLYVLRPEALTSAVSMTCQLNAQLPDHLLMEIDGSR